MMIKILQNQLEVANATIANLNETIRSMEARFNATIDELKKTNANLESLLKERDESLGKAASQMRGLKATYLPKKSEKQSPQAKPQTQEEKDVADEERKAKIKARGNNGAKRKDYFAVETKEEDVFPVNVDVNSGVEIGGKPALA